MTLNLPKDVESSINAAVDCGHFASPEDMVAEIVREYFRQRKPQPATPPSSGLGSIGAMRDDADLLDQAVEHAMKVREERPWRLTPGE